MIASLTIDSTTLSVASVVLGVLAIAPLIFKPLRRPVVWLWRKNVGQPISAWFQRQVRETVTPEITGQVQTQLKAYDDKLAQILAEFSKNGGTSMRDLGNRLEDKIDAVATKVDQTATKVDETHGRLGVLERRVDEALDRRP